MARKHFGISIHGDRMNGVVIEQQGKRVGVLSCAEVFLNGSNSCTEEFRQLGELLNLQKEEGLLGLPLSMLSVRNMEFPFTDIKKISQALPFELDDQLLQPIDEVVTDFTVTDTSETHSRVLAFAAEKEQLQVLLEQMGDSGLEPHAAVPGIIPIAEAVGKKHPTGWHLVLQTESSSVTIALVCDGNCRFCRRLSYPEEMILHPPFTFTGGILHIVDEQGARSCVKSVAAAVGRSLGFLKLNGMPVGDIEQVVVTGVMAGEESLYSIIGEQLGLKTTGVKVSSLLDIELSEQQVELLQSGHFEQALCLAYQGVMGKVSYNLRRGELAAKRKLFSSKKQMMATVAALLCLPLLLLGFFLYDQGRLAEKNDALRTEILSVYRTAFPAASRIQDPYVQMKVALRELETAGASVPAHSGRMGTLDYLADISHRIPATLPLQIARLVIDNQALRMRGVTENFNRVDEIKNRLASSPYYSLVQIVSATADKKTNKIRFEIQLLLRDT